ncbi:aminoglycoside 6-adenylyltransferase [Lachnoclostridium sp.]|uniref:aminoglycoside 6-adenylyltransferase n=1 Tax=Lachnoclostridium sp. TaxID=2028282 RepID=UPI00289F8453|nr:aminoglycoside 6-adenylyltransferase [Lachnoclostridium sp.]
MSRFDTIINNFVKWGNGTDKLYVALMIGSQARKDHPADDFSDLDIIMVVDDPDYYLYSSQWIEQIGNSHISFIENTIGGGKERRILFDNALDVDFVILSRNNFEIAIRSGEVEILKRGYRILIDKIGIEHLLPSISAEKPSYISLTECKFSNIINDFWYHAVWTAKKIIRGELWTAKSCVDNYMKGLLLSLIECHAHVLNGIDYDTWHNGRFLEEWAEDWIVQKLSNCFAHYERNDIKKALLSTMDLFRLITVEIADRLKYKYPTDADEYSTEWVINALSE